MVGKAGEALVAAELLRQGIDVAYPAYDCGVDLIAYQGHDFGRVVPIQVKARSYTNYTFHKVWFDSGIVLVQVWYVVIHPRFFVFSSLDQVEQALGPRGRWTASITSEIQPQSTQIACSVMRTSGRASDRD